MKTLEDYMKLNYRLEFEPDEDEGGYVAYFLSFPAVLLWGILLKRQRQMQLMLSVHGWKLPWKMKWEFLCLRKG